jgi:hypothetical protein
MSEGPKPSHLTMVIAEAIDDYAVRQNRLVTVMDVLTSLEDIRFILTEHLLRCQELQDVLSKPKAH